jgi:hypothetical protein
MVVTLSTESPKEPSRPTLRSLFSSADDPCKHTHLSGVPGKDLAAFSPEGLCRSDQADPSSPNEARALEREDHP